MDRYDDCVLKESLNTDFSIRMWHRTATAKFLIFKNFCNIGFVASIFMHSVQAFSDDGSLGQWLAAHSTPYSLFLANAFGTLGTWFTVLMTLESLVLITFPFKASKILCKFSYEYLP